MRVGVGEAGGNRRCSWLWVARPNWSASEAKGSASVQVRRDHLVADAFSELRGLGSGWKMPIRVKFIGHEGA